MKKKIYRLLLFVTAALPGLPISTAMAQCSGTALPSDPLEMLANGNFEQHLPNNTGGIIPNKPLTGEPACPIMF
jgi:hypothetical protein